MPNQFPLYGERIFAEIFDEFGGGLLIENVEIDTQFGGNDSTIATASAGYIGMTVGTDTRSVTLKNVLISRGTVDFERAKLTKTFLRVQLRNSSGQRCSFVGHQPGPVATTSGDSKNTEQDITIVGNATLFE